MVRVVQGSAMSGSAQRNSDEGRPIVIVSGAPPEFAQMRLDTNDLGS